MIQIPFFPRPTSRASGLLGGFLCMAFSLASVAAADVRPAFLFQDHMVLQREKPVLVWGWADPGEEVSVAFAGQSKSAQTNADGRWEVRLDPMPASAEGREMKITSNGKEVLLKNILVGEVWMAGGQSNMARLFSIDLSKGYTKRQAQADASADPLLRFINLKHDIAETPQKDLSGSRQADSRWMEASPKNTMKSASLPYFFAKELRASLGVPVGIVQHCVSGTPAGTWMDRDVYAKACPEDLERDTKNSDRKMAKDKDWKGWEAYNKAVADWEASGGKGEHPADINHLNRHNQPHVLYNALIHPIAGFTVRGMIWHRGEAGSSDYNHADKFRAMIDHWRSLWRDDFWVIVGSLTNIGSREDGKPAPGEFHFTNEQYWMNVAGVGGKGFAQGKAAMVALNDLGNSTALEPAEFQKLDKQNGVHYEAKDIAGKRYAMAARAVVYGESGPGLAPPVFESATIQGDKVKIKIANASGLALKTEKADGENLGFVIEDASGALHFAKASIEGDTITVWQDGVSQPKVVYYGFHNNPVLTVYNSMGHPLLSFRTANFGEKMAKAPRTGKGRDADVVD